MNGDRKMPTRKLLKLSISFFCIALMFCENKKQEQSHLPDLPDGVQAISLLGDTLFVSMLPEEVFLERNDQLQKARLEYNSHPNDVNFLIWLGRRTAYLGNYREAIDIYTEGLMRHQEDPKLFRHRGHRYITLRQFDHAIADFQKAVKHIHGKEDEIEPDGMPNARNIPTSTLQFNIWYHLGLSHYLKGDFESALKAYRACMQVSKNQDALVATSHWIYMTLRRLGKDGEASQILEPINADMDIIENGSYHRLLLLYKGDLDAGVLMDSAMNALDNATVGYGVGNYHYYNGRREEGSQYFKRILEGDQWASFGYIAAEAELSPFK